MQPSSFRAGITMESFTWLFRRRGGGEGRFDYSAQLRGNRPAILRTRGAFWENPCVDNGSPGEAPPRFTALVGPLGVAGLLFATLATATSLTKKPWFDEAHFTAPALDLVTRGSMGHPVVEPLGFASSPGIPQLRVNTRAYYAMPLSHLIPAAWYKLAGFGLFRMRALSTLWGLAGLGAWCFAVLEVTWSRAAAVCSAFLIATDRFFVNAGADGRPDMISAALGALALAAYLALRRRSVTRAVLISQTLLAAAVFTHPIGGIAIFAIAIVAMGLDRARLGWRHALVAAAPFALAGALWGWYISADPEAFRAQIAGNSVGRFQSFTAPVRALIDEVRLRFGDRGYLPASATGVRQITVLIPVIYAAAVIALLLARPLKRPGARWLGAAAVTYFFVFAICDGTKAAFYLVHFTPLLACWAACWAVFEWHRRGWRRWTSAGAAALLAVLQLLWIGYGIRRDSYRNLYLPAVAYLKQHAAPNDLIFAVSEFAFGLGFYDHVRDDSTLGYFTGKRAELIVVEDAGYGQAFDGFARLNPGLYRYVQNTLSHDYRKVYSNAVYDVYARR